MSKLHVGPTAVCPIAAWRWEWRSVLVWRAMLVRFEVVEVVGVLVDV